MKIVVTGGAGFIGSHVVDGLLAAGHHVIVVDALSSGSRDNLPHATKIHTIDIVDREAIVALFERERPDAVCHQAAQISVSRSIREPRFDAEVNCIGLLNVLDAAVHGGCRRVVFASTGGLCGDVTTPAPEAAPTSPARPALMSRTPHAASAARTSFHRYDWRAFVRLMRRPAPWLAESRDAAAPRPRTR